MLRYCRSLCEKFAKLDGVRAYAIFSEELGIRTFPDGAADKDVDHVVFVDPIDGTEFVEALQGGWSLLAVYDRRASPREDGVFEGCLEFLHAIHFLTGFDQYIFGHAEAAKAASARCDRRMGGLSLCGTITSRSTSLPSCGVPHA